MAVDRPKKAPPARLAKKVKEESKTTEEEDVDMNNEEVKASGPPSRLA